jgi:glycosyltransferase involved in cell wall biosynthesis
VRAAIITVCFNSADTVEDTVESVLAQRYSDVEHIIVDGGSTDGTQETVAKYNGHIKHFVSGPDEGIYDAMNKGIQLADGDFVGFLNADDVYADDHVISDVVAVAEEKSVDAVYGDLLYVQRDDTSKVVRYWKAGEYLPRAFRLGWVPPHPTFFCRRELFDRYGPFDATYRLAGDFELMLRFMEKHRIRVAYIPRPLVRMRVGGRANTVRGVLRGNREILRAFAANGMKPAAGFFWRKPLVKVGQLFRRPQGMPRVSVDQRRHMRATEDAG